ncbi:MAG TPA: hypothetical protein VK095_04755 [Beutenbergiaceae bacterium]|nr:hypothetical protein [Beutenbergiaceae bacterium]
MAGSVDTFYDGATPPLPIGVLPDDADEDDAGGHRVGELARAAVPHGHEGQL